jgi:hypothetical protein
MADTYQSLLPVFYASINASVELAFDMQPGLQYQLVAKGAIWFYIAATGAAAAQKQNSQTIYMPANVPYPVAAAGKANRIIAVSDAGAATDVQLSQLVNVA